VSPPPGSDDVLIVSGRGTVAGRSVVLVGTARRHASKEKSITTKSAKGTKGGHTSMPDVDQKILKSNARMRCVVLSLLNPFVPFALFVVNMRFDSISDRGQ